MLKNLGFEFSRDVYKDVSKRILLPAKWNLQGLMAWPDSDRRYVNAFGWFCFFNLVVAAVFHTNYVLVNFGDVKKMADACTTVATTLEAVVRTFVLVSKRRELNEILHKIWRLFWPCRVVGPKKLRAIKFTSYFSLALTTLFLTLAYLATSQLLTRPFFEHQLVLKSVFPFEWRRSWIYECLYVWQYFANWYMLFMVTGFDYLLISVVTICIVQYMIVQEVLEHMLDDDFDRHKVTLFGERGGHGLTPTQVLIRCLEQHKMLNRVCEQLENSFAVIILIQFFTSALAICMSAFIIKTDPSTAVKMGGFLTGHLFQLFYYCYVGNELEHQSTRLADSAYESNWHLRHDKNFNRILIMIIQRAQRKQCLTAAGITEMNFASFLRVLKISFSTYTLLDTMLQK